MSQSDPSTGRTRGSNFPLGTVFMLIGALIVAVAFDYFPIDRSALQAPPWVLAIFGLCFFIAGLWVIVQTVTRNRDNWVNSVFALVMMLLFSVLTLWIGFGPGHHLFVQSYQSGADTVRIPVNETAGRIFFGIFGVLMSLFTLAFGFNQLRKLLRKE
jgi:hypothetical protein